MTAKRRPRGTLARLDALEDREAARVEAVKADNLAKIEAAEAHLSAADRAAWQDALQVMEHGADPDGVERMHRACAHLPSEWPPITHPAKDDADAWADQSLDLRDGVPLLCPPPDRVADFLAYFELGAAQCDAEAVRVPLSPDVHRLARWGAALWRVQWGMCAVLGGRP